MNNKQSYEALLERQRDMKPSVRASIRRQRELAACGRYFASLKRIDCVVVSR